MPTTSCGWSTSARTIVVVVVHPLGALEARQQALPLETTIDRVGRNPVTVNRVNLGAPSVGGLPAKAVSASTDLFAPGEFLDLSNDEKLSRPGFEPFPSGVVIAGADTDLYGTPSDTSYQWDTVFPPKKLPRTWMLQTSMLGVHAAILSSGAAGKAYVASGNPYAVEAEKVVLAHPGQSHVRSVRDLAPIAGAPDGPLTTTEAARSWPAWVVSRSTSERGSVSEVALRSAELCDERVPLGPGEAVQAREHRPWPVHVPPLGAGRRRRGGGRASARRRPEGHPGGRGRRAGRRAARPRGQAADAPASPRARAMSSASTSGR